MLWQFVAPLSLRQGLSHHLRESGAFSFTMIDPVSQFCKWMILIHRYLGIALSPMFVVWFASGIAMMYARGMPGLTPQVRLEHLPSLDLARVGMTPAEAAEKAAFDTDPDQVA